MPPIPAGPWKTVTSVSELYTYLHSQPTLTLTQPYLIKAVGFNLDDLNSIGSIYKWTVRYIILDLTESFGTQILSVPSSISQDNQKRMIISLFLPDSVTTINAGGFAYYMGLKTAVMPKVAVIQNEAFNSSLNLETVYMPSVTSIGDTAFKDCRLLKEIVLGSVPPSLGQDVFANVPLGALEIFVPPGSFETYRLHPDWAALSDRLRLRSLP
jgi:hypothetical protein